MNTPEPAPPSDWRDQLARGVVDSGTVAAWRRSWAGDPGALEALELELALNAFLTATAAPPVASNFVSRVLDQTTRMPVRAARRSGFWPGMALPWRGLAFAAVVAAAGWGGWSWQQGRVPARNAMAAAEVTGMAAAGGVPPTALADFEAVRRLNASARPEDEALVIALLQ